MQKATIQLGTLTCPSCLQKIDKAVKSLEGVDKDSVNVMFNSSKVKLNFDDEKLSIDKIENAITALGYEVKKSQVKDNIVFKYNTVFALIDKLDSKPNIFQDVMNRHFRWLAIFEFLSIPYSQKSVILFL